MANKKKPGPRKDDNTLETLQNYLQASGIPVNAFGDMIDKGVRQNWSVSEFTLHIYGSPQFKLMFPGIFRPDGSLKMTPGEYRQQADNYISQARTFGIQHLNREQIGTLIGGDVSPQEFNDRMTAIRNVTQYKDSFDEFKQILRQRGIPTKGVDNDKEIVDFMLGKAPEKFYSIWNELTVGTAARTSGFGLGQKQVRQISKMPKFDQMTEAQIQDSFANLAQQARTIMPLSQAGKWGLTKKDLIQLEFGGPRQAAIAEKVQTIMANFEENDEQKAQITTSEIGQLQQQRAQS